MLLYSKLSDELVLSRPGWRDWNSTPHMLQIYGTRSFSFHICSYLSFCSVVYIPRWCYIYHHLSLFLVYFNTFFFSSFIIILYFPIPCTTYMLPFGSAFYSGIQCSKFLMCSPSMAFSCSIFSQGVSATSSVLKCSTQMSLIFCITWNSNSFCIFYVTQQQQQQQQQ